MGLFDDKLFGNYMRGCSSVVERTLCMCEAPGSIPGISIYFVIVDLMPAHSLTV